jgi:hypothetical protein
MRWRSQDLDYSARSGQKLARFPDGQLSPRDAGAMLNLGAGEAELQPWRKVEGPCTGARVINIVVRTEDAWYKTQIVIECLNSVLLTKA